MVSHLLGTDIDEVGGKLGIAVALLVGCAISFCVFAREQASRKRFDRWP